MASRKHDDRRRKPILRDRQLPAVASPEKGFRSAILRRGWLAAALLAFFIYLPTIGFDYTFDDHDIVLNNPRIRSLANTSAYLATSWWNLPSLNREYRPLTMASFAVNYALAGPRPGPFHATNALLHGVNAALVWLLVWRVFRRRGLALGSSLLFAIHPLHIEAVAGVVGRAELLMTLGFLTAMLAAHAAMRAEGMKRQLVWAAAVFPAALVAVFSKEHGIMLLPAILLLALLPPEGEAHSVVAEGSAFNWNRIWMNLRALFPALAASFVATLLYFQARDAVIGAYFTPAGTDISTFQNPLLKLAGIARLTMTMKVLAVNALLLLAPFRPSPDYSIGVIPAVQGLTDPYWLSGLAILLAIPVGAWLLRSKPAPLFGLFFMLITFLVGSNLIVRIGVMMAERLLYLPSAGFCVLIVALIMDMPKPPGAAAKLPMTALVLYGGALLVQHARYLPAWRNNETLFGYLVNHVPNSIRGQVSYGWTVAKEGRNSEALPHLKRAIQLVPLDADALAKAGVVYGRLGESEKALDLLHRAIALNPRYDLATSSLGSLLARLGRRDEAEQELKQAIHDFPNSYANHLELGLLYCDEGRWREASPNLEPCIPVVREEDRERLSSAVERMRAALAEAK